MSLFIKASKALGFLGGNSKPSKDLAWSINFLEWSVKPHEVIGLSRFVFIATLIIGFILSLLLAGFSLLILITLCLSLISSWLVTEYPKSQARIKALSELGYAPDVITVLVSSLELDPNLEQAVKLVSKHCNGLIAIDFSKAYKDSIIKGVPLKNLLMVIANKWGRFSDGFKQAVYLVISSLSERGDERRSLTLDSSLSNYLQSIINDQRSFLSKVRFSTMVLFSFGTVIPLVIISLLPVLTVMSSGANALQMLMLLSFSLIIIYAYSNHVLGSKPSSFSQVLISDKKSYPSKGDIRLGIGGLVVNANGLLYCLSLFLIISLPSMIYLLSLILEFTFIIPSEWSTLPLVIGFGVSLSVYFHGSSAYKVSDMRRALSLESEVLDVIYNLGSRVNEGRSVEDAFKQVTRMSKGKTIHDYLMNSYLRSRELSNPIESSLNKSLRRVDSARVKSIFSLFFNTLKRGVKGSSRVIYRFYNYFQKLVQAEADSTSMIKQLLSTMNMTAVVITPLISAMIIVMQQVIQSVINQSMKGLKLIGLNLFENPDLSFELTQLLLGLYMIVLLIILVRYVVIIQGGNQVSLRITLSKSIIIALIVYAATLITASVFT